jgi:hypothetical protein
VAKLTRLAKRFGSGRNPANLPWAVTAQARDMIRKPVRVVVQDGRVQVEGLDTPILITV